jgi:hypothetical protein
MNLVVRERLRGIREVDHNNGPMNRGATMVQGTVATASGPRLGEEAMRGVVPQGQGGSDRADRGYAATSKTENESDGILVNSLLP